jgi:hypothetical protein
METTPLFDFGLIRCNYNPPFGVTRIWEWSLVFRTEPNEFYHVIRKTGNLRRWGSDTITARGVYVHA